MATTRPNDPIKEKLVEQLRDLRSAVSRLKEVLLLPPTRVHKDATIKRFEFTLELAWKLMQTLAQYNNIESFGPRNAIRTAAQLGYIDNPQPWFETLKTRNLTAHVYNEPIADKAYEQTKSLPPLVEQLLSTIEEKGVFTEENETNQTQENPPAH